MMYPLSDLQKIRRLLVYVQGTEVSVDSCISYSNVSEIAELENTKGTWQNTIVYNFVSRFL